MGKTTLLQQFGKDYFPQVHTFNFEENLALGKLFSDKYDSPYYVIFNAEHPSCKERVRRYPLYLAERFLGFSKNIYSSIL